MCSTALASSSPNAINTSSFGIGLGALLYALGPQQRRPTLVGFALTSMIEALCIIVPFKLGDRIAMLTLVLRPLGFAGFGSLVALWLLVSLIVVFPAAVCAGYQFPLLLALLVGLDPGGLTLRARLHNREEQLRALLRRQLQ